LPSFAAPLQLLIPFVLPFDHTFKLLGEVPAFKVSLLHIVQVDVVDVVD